MYGVYRPHPKPPTDRRLHVRCVPWSNQDVDATLYLRDVFFCSSALLHAGWMEPDHHSLLADSLGWVLLSASSACRPFASLAPMFLILLSLIRVRIVPHPMAVAVPPAVHNTAHNDYPVGNKKLSRTHVASE